MFVPRDKEGGEHRRPASGEDALGVFVFKHDINPDGQHQQVAEQDAGRHQVK